MDMETCASEGDFMLSRNEARNESELFPIIWRSALKFQIRNGSWTTSIFQWECVCVCVCVCITVLGQYIFYFTDSCSVPWIILEDKPTCTLSWHGEIFMLSLNLIIKVLFALPAGRLFVCE